MEDLESQKRNNNDDNVVESIILGATCPTQPNQPLTVMVKHHVRPDKLDVFANWCREIQVYCRQFEGYLGAEIIRPTCVESDEYVAIFRYDNYEHLQAWMDSNERREMIQ